MKNKKILVVGCGGIGSWLVEMINQAYEQGQVDPRIETHISDFDTVAPKNVKYQNFTIEDVGKTKVEALLKRYGFIARGVGRITKGNIIDYDIIISAVDNFETRKEIFEYCHNRGKEFIDLRAEGRRIFYMTKGKDLEEDLSTLNIKDKKSGSCQRDDDLREGRIEYGNRIVAAYGIQLLINVLRHKKNESNICFVEI